MSYLINKRNLSRIVFFSFLGLFPVFLAFSILSLWHWDFSIPLAYDNPGADEIWQLIATKTLLDTGWILTNPFMGAPGISTWYANSASQISVLHQLMMLGIGLFIDNAIKVQQYYFIFNFALITISTYVLARSVNIAPIVAASIGIAYSFTSYRLHYLFFAYLGNYFFIPISLIPVYWILQGKYTTEFQGQKGPDRSPRFYLIIGCIISIMTALSDGYYSFFYVLLLAFAILFRCLNGDLKHPRNLVAPLLLPVLVLATSFVATIPLREHRATHIHEADQDRIKLPTDAEVYAPTLKLLVAPNPDHRIESIGRVGKYLIETANFNRKFPYPPPGAPAVLGIAGSLFLASLFCVLLIRTNAKRALRSGDAESDASCAYVSSLLALFILLCSTSGGIGSLIAIVFPTIRAYDRFPIFLILVVYIGMGSLITVPLRTAAGWRRLAGLAALPAVTALIVLDQTPRDLLGLTVPSDFQARSERFLAERAFIADLERQVPANSMIYQFPYSQYLSENRYYGWGKFGQLRAYLHSRSLRWSNGAAKGSYVDAWHEHKAALPLESLIFEIQAAGFEGILVDRLVVKDDEFSELKRKLDLIAKGPPMADDAARLAFWKLEKLPFRLTYMTDMSAIKGLTVFKKLDFENQPLPRSINRMELRTALANVGDANFPIEIMRNTNPLVFNNHDYVSGSLGELKIPNSELKGRVVCASEPTGQVGATSEVDLTIINAATFDWRLGYGKYPIRIGALISDSSGNVLIDARVPAEMLLKSGESTKVKVNMLEVLSKSKTSLPPHLSVSFKLVQDANAWFEGGPDSRCDLKIALTAVQ